ncbi:hypothetical protein Aspvir_007467 [Aspergillus viridinutans]|uniref:Uncharacterized protein n=1 Tax=Aspergillus viridinutans TaxID=75553 RepID=A0A9P3BVR5_ASPVI|nr:uncharacterized protein Aspvir_007467 [Aspergillus viridinutans]GIK03398.1 hypothetical protein Aspvir_007467 [Aspergillus viridinutans]
MQHELVYTHLPDSKTYLQVGTADTTHIPPPITTESAAHTFQTNLGALATTPAAWQPSYTKLRRRRRAELDRRIPSPPQGRHTARIGVSFAQSSGYGAAAMVHTGYLYTPVVQARWTCCDAWVSEDHGHSGKNLLVNTG